MRILAPLVIGAGFIPALLFAIVTSVFTPGFSMTADMTAVKEFHKDPESVAFSFKGPLGKYDNRQLQRGFQVYKEVCSSCHSMKLLSFNDLKGIGYNEAEVKAIAKGWQKKQPTISSKDGSETTRDNIPSDHFPGPYANETEARGANNGALPPDMSLLTKAREGGADYVHALVTGYQDIPAAQLREYPDTKPDNKHYYNPYFSALNIAMPPPLKADGLVSYKDGTKSTRDQMATDVSAFLTWTAEPKLESRHAAGLASVIFLLIFSVLAWMSYQEIWRDKEH